MASPTQSQNTPESEQADEPPPSQNSLSPQTPPETPPETPNEGSLDENLPDESVPDESVSDESVSDESAPDEAAPDESASDEAITGPGEREEENAEENVGLDKIHLRINFRIGEISMPVNDLASLTPGFTLTDLPGLTFPRAQAVASGRAFAEGELVDIDGKIGFRITRLLS